MKILYIWNTAGTGTTLSKYLQDRIESKVIVWRPFNHRFGYGEGQSFLEEHDNFKFYLLNIFLKAHKFDIIHVHSSDKILPILRRCTKAKILMQYHGEVRDEWVQRERYWKYADAITVINKDLLNGAPEGTFYLPYVVDSELFKRAIPFTPKTALFVKMNYGEQDDALELAKDFCDFNKINLTVQDRNKQIIPYKEYPSFIQQFEWFIDYKWDKGRILTDFSQNAIEFLCMGGKVFHDKGTFTKLPDEFKLENVIESYYNVYKELIEK